MCVHNAKSPQLTRLPCKAYPVPDFFLWENRKYFKGGGGLPIMGLGVKSIARGGVKFLGGGVVYDGHSAIHKYSVKYIFIPYYSFCDN